MIVERAMELPLLLAKLLLARVSLFAFFLPTILLGLWNQGQRDVKMAKKDKI
jgi:hypothetical protein